MSNDTRINSGATILLSQHGPSYTAGFLCVQLAAAVAALPKTKQEAFVRTFEAMVGNVCKVKVNNLMSGLEVEIPWDQAGTCLDPSQERYWSM